MELGVLIKENITLLIIPTLQRSEAETFKYVWRTYTTFKSEKDPYQCFSIASWNRSAIIL